MAAVESQFHVLAVDDSVIDRKLIEMLLKTSACQGTFLILILGFWVYEFGILLFAILYSLISWVTIWDINSIVDAVTTVDSGSKALEFLGLQENDKNQTCVSLDNHQVIF